MAGRLRNKLALVTGASRGIGRAIATTFIAEGATVIAADKDEPSDEFGDHLRGGATFRRLDVTREADWQELSKELTSIDIVVNNAGAVLSYAPIDELPLGDWNRIIETNLTSVYLSLRYTLPSMLQAGRGSIVNISSIAGIVGHAGIPAYQASKAGIRLLTKNVAITYARRGIRCNSIHPGLIQTPMVEMQPAEATAAFLEATPLGRAGDPKDVAYAAVYLASDEAEFVTGAELCVDGGYVSQ